MFTDEEKIIRNIKELLNDFFRETVYIDFIMNAVIVVLLIIIILFLIRITNQIRWIQKDITSYTNSNKER